MKKKLFVHGTLRKGHMFHFLLWGCKRTSDCDEIYFISRTRLWFIDVFECMLGWHRYYRQILSADYGITSDRYTYMYIKI